MKAGLDAKVADELTLGKRPSAVSDDEAAVYEFCIQLHRTRNVDDATFNRALALFGEQGVVDLIGVSGYYTAVSMTLNVAQVMPPEGAPLPLKLNEFAILITAREWTSQYEWYAHYPLALKAGLDAKLADELALGKRPSAMKDDEAAVYDFCIELHRTRNVGDAAFNRALGLFGEQGVVDLIGVSGYYTAVSMTLNVAHVMPPDDVPLPLKPLNGARSE